MADFTGVKNELFFNSNCSNPFIFKIVKTFKVSFCIISVNGVIYTILFIKFIIEVEVVNIKSEWGKNNNSK